MNYLEFPDGSLFWQQTTYATGAVGLVLIAVKTRKG